MIVDKRFVDVDVEHFDCIREALRQIRTKSSDYEWAQLMKRFEKNRDAYQHLINLEREEI